MTKRRTVPAPRPRERTSMPIALLGAAAAFIGAGCSSSPPPGATQAATAAPAAPASASAQPIASAAPPAPPMFREDDFVESEQSRDPFRSYATVFAADAKMHVKPSQRPVLLDQYSIDELKLVALVTHIDDPRAMLVDPTGKGWIVSRGQFVGKAELVHAGKGGEEYPVNWRVDRILDEDLWLVRDDPTHDGVTAATRVLTLRTDKDEPKSLPQ